MYKYTELSLVEEPATWMLRKLDELGSLNRGKSKHRPRNDPSLFGGQYPFIQTGDVKSSNFYIKDYSYTYNEVGLTQSKLWDKGTLCITIAANIAESGILAIDACFPDSIVGFVPDNNKCDIRFIKYWVDSFKLRMQSISSGTTQDNLSLDKLRTFDIFTPPLQTQQKIASILSAYDDLIENNNRRIQTLGEMAQSIYREWFVHFRFPGHENVKMVDSELGKIPEGWAVSLVENAIDRYRPGKLFSQKTVKEYGKVPVLDQGRSGIIGYHDEAPGVDASVADPIIVFANHTCYQRLILFPFSAIQNVLPFKSNSQLKRDLFWLHYSTKDLVEFNDYKGHWPEFISKKIVVPSIEYCDKFGELLRPIYEMLNHFESKNQALRKTRDLLLPRLISGRLDVEDLDIEDLDIEV